jgi:predicted P-loop ATPase
MKKKSPITQESLRTFGCSQGYNLAQPWSKLLSVNKRGKVENTNKQLAIIFQNDTELTGFYRDEITLTDHITQASAVLNMKKDDEVDDEKLHNVVVYLSKHYGLEVGRKLVRDYVLGNAAKNTINRVRDYLSAQEWDKVPRLDELFIKAVGAEDTPYVRAATAHTFIGAVARALDPGCKMDTVLVLEGPQGAKKSTLLAEMARVAGHQYCTVSNIDPTAKDTMQQISRHWFVIIDEFDKLSNYAVAQLKSFITMDQDTYRAPYATTSRTHKRRCVFVASINRDAANYLTDATGNRRFYPIESTLDTADLEYVKANKHQLWAEATARYHTEKKWWMDKKEAVWKEASEAQDERQSTDPWEPEISRWVKDRVKLKLDIFDYDDLLTGVFPEVKLGDRTIADKRRAGRVLTKLGLKQHRGVYKGVDNARIFKAADMVAHAPEVLPLNPTTAEREKLTN